MLGLRSRRSRRTIPVSSQLLLSALLLLASPGSGQQTHPFSVDDMLAMQRISSPALSPDARAIAFVVRTTDLDANRGRTNLWIVERSGKSEPRELTVHEAADHSPQWSPDGRSIYFLSTRSGTSQVWRLQLRGGEPEQVTNLPLDVGNLLLSPDGRRLAFTMEVFPDCPDLRCTAGRLERRRESQETGQTFDELFFRHWDTYEDGRRSHLFTLALDEKGEPAGEPVDLVPGLKADVPSLPFGGTEEIAWSPDGEVMVFASRVDGALEPWSTNFDLWATRADGSGRLRNLTAANTAWDTHPMFTPDGRALVWFAMSTPGYESDRFRLMTAPWDGEQLGSPREIAPNMGPLPR